MQSDADTASTVEGSNANHPTGDALVAAFFDLEAQCEQQSQIIEKKSEVITAQQARINILEEKLRLNTIERFAASSEKNPLQLDCFNEVEALADNDAELDEDQDKSHSPETGQKTKRRRNKKLSGDIPRVQHRYRLNDEQREGAIDTFFVTVKEELDITPAKVQVIEYLQEKAVYLDAQGKRCLRAADRPAHPLGKSIASTTLLAFIIIAKYCDGMPLYRLETTLKRYGGSITRALMASWLIRLSLQIQPVINLLKEVQLSADYLQGDETRLQVLKEPGMNPTGDKWIWVLRGGPPGKPVVMFDYDKSRGNAVVQRLLEGFEGRFFQSDGYAGYDGPVKALGATHLGCFDHARRRFVQAIKAIPKAKQSKGAPAKCVVALSKIDALYRVERQMDKRQLTEEERYTYRQEQVIPMLEKLHNWLIANAPSVEKDSLTYKAMKYTLKQWPKLIRYCDHGQLRISNILAENAIRPFVIGRKGWLFSDTPAGARASAMYYTLIESAKANDIDPFEYIKYVIDNITAAKSVEDIEALLPWNMNRDSGQAIPATLI